MSLPLNMMEPESGRYIPLMRFKRVDFPAPLGPTRPTISPWPTWISTLETATRPPNVLVRLVAWSRINHL